MKYCQTCKDFKCFSIGLTQETEDRQGDIIHESCSIMRNGNYSIHGQHLMIRVYMVLCFSNTNEKTFKILMKSNLCIVCGYYDSHENPVQNTTSSTAIQSRFQLFTKTVSLIIKFHKYLLRFYSPSCFMVQ